MKEKVNPDLFRKCMLDQGFRHARPIYSSSKEDGGTTMDIEKADIDDYRQPVCVGYSRSEFVPHDVYAKPQILSFNPADPTARERAFLARDAMLTYGNVMPIDYTDKFSALAKVNNAATAFEKNYRSTLGELKIPEPKIPEQND